MTFSDFFTKACGYGPYPFQIRFAEEPNLPQLLRIPTGLGKTATVILGWLYRRIHSANSIKVSTPHRLVYCLPMRTLVEQTRDAAEKWLEKIDRKDVGVHLLMGGEEPGSWDANPEQDAILIGTQDMLVSRALNRGYGISRYRWPVHFSLLNNDALWVIDETQLMGPSLTTSAQLAGLRQKLGTVGGCHTVWMSATLDQQALRTVDHAEEISADRVHALGAKDYANKNVQRLVAAAKPIEQSKLTLSADTKGKHVKELAAQVVNAHQPETITLVVINRVQRAQELFEAVKAELKRKKGEAESFLIHSRFRRQDRQGMQAKALDESSVPPAGRILVATQAIEAGVDISATTLLTELAPWSSLVQRFGRCNRRGLCGEKGHPPARVVWVDISTEDKGAKDLALPYEPASLDASRVHLQQLDAVGPESLKSVQHVEDPPVYHVLRRKDLLELFDTTADLSGNDLDVSRYIRDADDTDAQVYWRSWDLKLNRGSPPDPKSEDGAIVFPAARRDELCSVSVAALRGEKGFVKKSKDLVWAWDPLESHWDKVGPNEVRPGMTLLIHVSAGGYSKELGWTGDPANVLKAEDVAVDDKENLRANERLSEDDLGSSAVTLARHLKDVADHAVSLSTSPTLQGDKIPWPAIIRAAWWHDVGKAHPAFQGAIHHAQRTGPPLDIKELWAKSGVAGRLNYLDSNGHTRVGFRHELASMLAWLHKHDGSPDADLIAFLIAAHHGKVRLSLRSMPNESGNSSDPDSRFARGVWQGDVIPEVSIENGDVSSAFEVSLDLMLLGDRDGRPSWLSRCLKLLADQNIGPFRLAYYETLLRVADWRGSGLGGKS